MLPACVKASAHTELDSDNKGSELKFYRVAKQQTKQTNRKALDDEVKLIILRKQTKTRNKGKIQQSTKT